MLLLSCILLVLDSSNKLSTNYGFNSGNGKVKYNYVHRGASTFEPSYDFAKNSWDFAVSLRIYADVVKATYQTCNRVLGLELSRSFKFNGAFMIGKTFGPEFIVKLYLAGAMTDSIFYLAYHAFLAPSFQVCRMLGMDEAACPWEYMFSVLSFYSVLRKKHYARTI